ncbi:MAG: cupin domain-containing protein [Gammaproteobacteria bacterium HGW-Gammaproteobacteria-1]|jgi:quercetin dioxygenase-like cupin family protein|nr:MAG: cupin domain-containing protein [Gammaproteobacteria bacterium HGW-Gammaproteobacteria-1]
MKYFAAALCLAALFSTTVHAESGTVTVGTLAQSTRSWNGTTLPAYPAAPPEISVLRIEVAPGAQLPLHRHPVINAGYMISGELTVITEQNETLHLKAGDAVVEVVNTWHQGRNEGREPAVIVVFYAGVVGVPLSERKN